MTQTKYLLAMIFVAFISGCSKTDSSGNTMVALNPTLVSVTTIVPTITFTADLTPTPLPTVTNTATTIPTATPAPTSTASPTPTVTPSPTPSLWQTFPTSEPANPAGVNLELVNQVGGAIRVVEVVENYAYLGIGPRLIVVDISNPSAPYQVGQSDILPGLIQSIKVANNIAFVLLNTKVVWFVNVFEPTNPQVLRPFLTDISITKIDTEGHTLYTSSTVNNQQTLTLYNLATPDAPALITSIATTGWWSLEGNILTFLTPDENNLASRWDMTNPLDPQITFVPDTVAPGGYLFSAAGTHIYFYGDRPDTRLQIVDIADPENPTLVGRDDEFRLGLGKILALDEQLFLIHDFCDAGSCGAGVEILDVSDPERIREIHRAGVGHLAYGAVVANGLLYVATGEKLSIVAPDTRGVIGSFQVTGNITHVGVAEQTLYALDSFDTTLYVYSLTNAGQPLLPVPYDVKAGYVQDFFLTPDFGYVATGAGQAPGTIEILDIQQPTVITAVGQFTTTEYVGSMENIFVTDNYAFALLDDNLAVLDATHPTELQLLAQFDLGFDSFLWHEDVLYGATGPYVAEEFIGVRIFDAHDPQNPEEIAYLRGVLRLLAVVDGYAYAATEEGISVLDVSTLPDVRVVYTIPQNYLVQDAILLDHYLVVATDHLLVYDLSVPEQPTLLSSFTLFSPYDYSTIGLVASWENFVYVADAAAGVLVFQLTQQ